MPLELQRDLPADRSPRRAGAEEFYSHNKVDTHGLTPVALEMQNSEQTLPAFGGFHPRAIARGPQPGNCVRKCVRLHYNDFIVTAIRQSLFLKKYWCQAVGARLDRRETFR